MTLYELNKAGYNSLPDMTEEAMKSAVDTLVQFLTTFDSNYYMLLNNEEHYYTLFTYKDKHDYYQMAREIISAAECLGSFKAIERNSDIVEFWIKDPDLDETKMYVLFNYEMGVIKV